MFIRDYVLFFAVNPILLAIYWQLPPFGICSVVLFEHKYRSPNMKNHEWKNQYSIRKTYLYYTTIQETCEVVLATPHFSYCRVTIDVTPCLYTKTVESYRILIAKPKIYIKDHQPS